MQRVKRKEKELIPNNNNFQRVSAINNNISNGNNKKYVKQNTFLYKDIIANRINKFLSFQERQKIISEINESKNQLNLYQPPPPPPQDQNEIKSIKRNENHKNMLYIKKTKSNLNLSNKAQKKSCNINTRNINYIITQNYKNSKENKNFINKTIK